MRSIGWGSGEPAVFAPYSPFPLGPPATTATLRDVREVGPDLAVLPNFASAGRRWAEAGRRGSWERVTEAAQALPARRVAGKWCWRWARLTEPEPVAARSPQAGGAASRRP